MANALRVGDHLLQRLGVPATAAHTMDATATASGSGNPANSSGGW